MRIANVRIIGIEESKDFLIKVPEKIFNKIAEENFPNLKKEIPMDIQEAYRIPNRLDQKRNSSHNITVKTPNAQNKERIQKAIRSSNIYRQTYQNYTSILTSDYKS